MELMYNELSEMPLSNNQKLANLKVTRLILCFKASCEFGFTKIRFSKHFCQIELSDGYSLEDWLEKTNNRNQKNILLAAKTYPFIKDDDTMGANKYIENYFYFEDETHDFVRTSCDGLAAAHIYNTLFFGTFCIF